MNTLNNTDEILNIVNEHDYVIGQKYKSQIYQEKASNFRVINAFIINDKKELWIPTRSAHKKLFPSCLDASVGGHVSAGEDYESAFKRETMEELNINLQDTSYKFLIKLTPDEHKTSAFMHLYAIYSNETPAYNTDDFSDYRWIKPQDLEQMLRNNKPAKGDLPLLINALEKFM